MLSVNYLTQFLLQGVDHFDMLLKLKYYRQKEPLNLNSFVERKEKKSAPSNFTGNCK